MIDKKRILQFIGLATRAGKMVSGFEATVDSVSKGEVKILLISEDISRNTLSKLLDNIAASAYEPEAYRFGTAEELGNCTGKRPRAIVAITDEGFANKLRVMLEEYNDNSNDETEDKN